MSLAKSKNEFSKRDMNFFSEFSSAASQNFSSAFPFFLLAVLSIIIITLIVWIACSVSTMKKNNRINDLRADMAKPEYLAKLAEKDKSQAEVEELQKYYYVISTLFAKVNTTSTATAETFQACRDTLPDDTYLTYYDDRDGVVELRGVCIDRLSASNYQKLLFDKGLFSFVESKITAYNPIENGYGDKTLMFGEMKYEFIFKCTRNGHYSVNWAYFLDGPSLTPLTDLKTSSYNAGQEYTINDVATYTENGISYTLTNIKINGVPVSAAVLADAISSNTLKGKVSTNLTIDLVFTAPKTTEGGEA